MRRLAWLACLLALVTSVAAAEEVSTPDGRLRVGADGSASPSGASGTVSAGVGAFGFSNTVEADPNHLRVTNPPASGAYELSRSGFRIEGDETFGPPVARATIGTGGITESIDGFGRLTGLGWPGPGMYDHVNYLNVSRGHPDKGAPANGGSFGGFGSQWLTPSFGWRTVSQAYASDTTERLVTVLANDRGDQVTITDVVDPAEDLVARNFRFSTVRLAPCFPCGGLAYYANMNPTTARLPRAPSVTDGAADNASDFGTVYDEATSAMLHFRPAKADPAALTILATSYPGPARAAEAVSGAFGPGVYIAVGGQQRASGFQAGLESAGLVRAEAEGTPLLDPYYDIADGRLSGSLAAFGKTAGALGGLPPDPDGSFTVYLAAAEDAASALGIVERARVRRFARIRDEADAWWAAWISRARLPATLDPQTLAVARHALMLIRTAQDRRTGAIVANATVQTPYRQDWVRDGAFFNYALLLAGYPEMAIRHADFYRRVYRPGGTWDSFYYPDGAEAGFVYPYEIDSQAFALWALWLPYAFGEADLAYLGRVYPAIRETADALLLCSDPRNGLQCPAAEDDAVFPTQGAQGAATLYLALTKAAGAADALGRPDGARWRVRAAELRAAALSKLCGATCQGGRGGVYLVWPSRLVDPDDSDPAVASLAQAHLGQYVGELDRWSSLAAPPPGGYLQYPMEPLLALGPFWKPADPDRGTSLDRWVRWLTHDLAEPGVLHYGERIFHLGGGRYLHSVGFPHIWSGTEMYLAAAFAHGLSGCPLGRHVGEAACRG